MDIKQIVELLGPEQFAGNEITSGFLADAVASFSVNTASSASAIRQLQSIDPAGLAVAALRLLISAEETSAGLQYVAGLVTADKLLIEPLLDERVLTLTSAAPLARKLSALERCLDVHLVGTLVARSGGKIAATPSAAALHVLALVDEISDCSRLASYLVRFLRHPSAKVRSKAALLLGRANWNLTRVKSFLTSEDGRVRANAVESLWGHAGEDVRKLLWEATGDSCGRVVVNALLGLCQMGDRRAYSRLMKLAEVADPLLRCGAAWAMGEAGNPEFSEVLEKLEQDGSSKVKAMAMKSSKKLRGGAAPEATASEATNSLATGT